MSNTIHREALFGPPRVSAPDHRDHIGRRAVFSAGRRRPGNVVVDCATCEARTPVVLARLPLRLVPSVWIPGRTFSRWMRCPSCSAFSWCRIDWRALRP